MLRLIPSGPSITRESPRNLSAKLSPYRSTTSAPKSIGTSAPQPARIRTHGGRVHTSSRSLLLSGTLSTETHFVRAFSFQHSAGLLPHDIKPADCSRLLARPKRLCSTLLLFRCVVPHASVARKSPVLRAQKTREPQRRSRGSLTNAAGRPESAVPEIGSSLS